MRRFLVAMVFAILAIGGFLAGRVSAQQVTPREHTAFHTFPKAWGDFITAVPVPAGYTYFFEGTDAVRSVRVGPSGIEDIEVIRRTGTAPAITPRSRGGLQ